MRPGVARIVREALYSAPIIAANEPWARFRRRQDEWLRREYADATRLISGELSDYRPGTLEDMLHGEGMGRPIGAKLKEVVR